MAQVPDFGALVSQQNQANNAASNLTNQANRPNQYNRLGSSTWGLDGSGNWTQSSTLDPWANDLFGRTMSGQQNLSSQVGAGLNQSGLPSFGATDLTGNLGAMPQVGQYNQQVINTMNQLAQPGLDRNAAALRSRNAAMGITGGSSIANNSENLIGQNWNDSSLKSILAGYQQGNTEYDQALRGRTQQYGENLGQSQNMTAQRLAAENERKDAFSAAQSGMTALTGVRDSLNPNKWNADVPTSAAYLPQTIYGAAQDTFNANQMNENQAIAQRNTNQNQTIGAASALLGNQGLGGLWGAAGNLWSGAQGLWNSWNTPSYSVGDSTWNNYAQLEANAAG